ncbi:MAG: endonuclease/exonuclease/phosphatase family protein [Eubacterium sp.]|nr:endonuclease/exonuclease/phosphatase family protein [Eubacterium sp.]
MKLEIRINNVNGFNNTVIEDDRKHYIYRSYKDRLFEILHDAKDDIPDIWWLQEIRPGVKEHQILNELKLKAEMLGLTLVTTVDEADFEKHPKSLLNVLLIKDVNEFEVLKTQKEISLYRRINYIRVNFKSAPNRDFYILHIHAPQIDYFPGHSINDGYVRRRKYLEREFYRALKYEVSQLVEQKKNVIVLGDFNKSLQSDDLKDLMKSGLTVVSGGMERTYYGPGNNRSKSIDHILMANNLADDESFKLIRSVTDRNVVTNRLTDHATIKVGVNV